MPANNSLVVEDDRFLRVVGIVLDPTTPAERTAAYADFFAHDEPDFDGYCQRVRKRVGRLFPRDVRLVETQEEMRAALPGSPALVVESLGVGAEELSAGSELRIVQKYGGWPRNIDTAACAAKGVKVSTLTTEGRQQFVDLSKRAWSLLMPADDLAIFVAAADRARQ